MERRKRVTVGRLLAVAVGVALTTAVISPGHAGGASPPTISVAVDSSAAAEGDSGATPHVVTFTISIDSAPAAGESYTVHWAVGGTATRDSDYTSPNAAGNDFTFDDSHTTKVVTASIVGDNAPEADETVTLQLSDGRCGFADCVVPNLGGDATHTITDDDTVSISVGDAARAEDVGPLPFPVTLSHPVGHPITFNYALHDGSATLNSDYRRPADFGSQPVTIPAGQTGVPILVPLVDDNVHENTETFDIELSNPGSGATIAKPQATGTIQDDDEVPPPAPNPGIKIDNLTIAEGTGGTTTAKFKVTLLGANTAGVTFNWSTADGTAKAPGDYTPMGSGFVNMPRGVQTADLTVLVAGDSVDETDETFSVLLSNVAGADTTAPSTTSAVGTIVDDDLPALSILDATASEGDALNFTVVLTAGAPHPDPITVAYATGNGPSPSATAGSDYPSATGTLTFASTDTSKTISIPTTDDALVEPTESVNLTLSKPVGAVISDGTGTGRILDNDLPTTTSRSTTTAPLPAVGNQLATGPEMTITAKPSIVVPKTAVIVIGVGCPADATGPCSGTLSLLTPKEIRLALVSFTALKPGTTAQIKLKLPVAVLKVLRGGKFVTLNFRVIASMPGSAYGEAEQVVKLKYTPPKKKAKPTKKKPKTSISITIPKK